LAYFNLGGIMSLSNKALLVYLNISQWTGRKLDRRATGAVEGQFETQKRVGNYTKKLLPGARELEHIQALAGQTRDYYYKNTLPWLSDGARILSGDHYLEFMREFASKKAKFNAAVEAFLVEYPHLKGAARAKLGQLFNEMEYPSEVRLRGAFKCEVSCMPMPEVGDFRTEVLDSEKDEFVKKMREVEANATRECFDRLQDVVTKAVSKLNDPKAIFRDSLITNILSICDLLPKLNITGDAALEQSRREVQALANSIVPDICRVNVNERQDAAKKLADLNKKMGALMGVQ
jgi:hypothetical protein